MRNALILISFLCGMIASACAEEINIWKNVRIVTEDLAPLGYIDKKDNKLKGETAEKVQRAMEYLGVSNKIEVYPWARALMMAQNLENIFIFNVARTPEREEQFKWVYKTKTKKTGVFALKSRTDIIINGFEDLKKYKVVVLNRNIVHLSLLKKGFDKVDNIHFHPMPNENLIIPFLFAGRADIWIKTYLNESEIGDKIRENGKNPDEFVRLFVIEDMNIDLYLAASLKTSSDMVAKFREAMETLK